MSSYKLKKNTSSQINFHCDHVTGTYLQNVSNFKVKDTVIIINIGSTPAFIVGEPIKSIAPQKSTILRNVKIISASNIIIVRIIDRENLGSIILQVGWETAYQLFGENLKSVPLWRSPIEEIGTIKLNPYKLTNSEVNHEVECSYTIKCNLWFATQKTDCAIHNLHDFIEFHTQIVGIGRMQKFVAQDKGMLYEDQILAEGITHDIFCGIDDKAYRYPWHQYYADTDCVWLVIELHPNKLQHESKKYVSG